MNTTDSNDRHKSRFKFLAIAARTMISLVTGCLGALIVFGLLTGLVWLIVGRDGKGLKLGLLLFVAASSFLASGWISGKIAGRKQRWHGLAVGLLMGLFSFGYILGPQATCLPPALGAGLFGYFGGRLAESSDG